MQEVGKVTHYYGKIGVAIVELSQSLKVGDKIKVVGSHTEFEQPISSMEVDRKPVSEAGAGDIVGLKVVERVSEGAVVHRVEG
jgi:putative protease